MKRLLFAILLILPFLLSGQDAVLGLNLGHTGAVTGLRFSSDGKYLLSSSADRTLKLWDVASGKLLQTSPEIGDPPFAGQLFLFPERGLATYATAGGLNNWYNWIWNLKTNSLKDGNAFSARPVESGPIDFPGIPGTPKDPPTRDYESELWDLAMVEFIDNSDQSLYASNGSGDPHKGFFTDGEHYYRRAGDQLTFQGIWDDQTYPPVTYPGLTKVFAFSSDGRYIFGSPQGPAGRKVAIWETNSGAVLAEIDLPAGAYVSDVRPDGKYLLVITTDGQFGWYDITQQQLLGIYPQVPPAGLPDTDDPSGRSYFNQAAISPTGHVAALGSADGAIYLQDLVSGKQKTVLCGYTQAVERAQFNADGSTIRFRLSDGSGRSWQLSTGIVRNDPVPVSATTNGQDIIALSADGQLAVRHGANKMLELWDQSTNTKLTDIGRADELSRPGNEVTGAIFSPDKQQLFFLTELIARRASATHILWDIAGKQEVQSFPVSINNGLVRAAFSPDGQYLLFAKAEGDISVMSLSSGQNIHTFEGHENSVEQLVFSPNAPTRFLSLTGARDGTVKLWGIEKQTQLATLINLDGGNWVVIGADGLFDASPQAMELLFYKVQQPGETEVIELEQLKSRYYEPGLLQKLTGFSDERIRSVDGLDQVALYPEVIAGIENDQLQIELRERSGGIGPVSIFVNGKEVAKDANPERATSISYDLRPVQNYLFRHPDSINTVTLRVYNREGWLKSNAIELPYRPTAWSRGSGGNASAWQGKLDPKMYVIAIGTSDYTGTQLDLQYATQDATAMARALQAVGGNLFANGDSVEVYALTTAKKESTGLEGTPIKWKFASKENVKATLEVIKKKSKAEDVLLVYLSGHGLTYGSSEQSQFYYLTSSVASEEMIGDADVRNTYTISSGELTEWINEIPALKQVLVVDACNSGKVVENLTGGTRNLNASQIRALDRMQDRTGMFILSGSAADKVSYEASEYGQGLLTYALLQGMLGVATRRTADGDYVDVMKLFQYARDEVPRLAASINGIQTPMLGFPTSGASFDIGIIKDQSSIPIGSKKPVMIRPTFLNQATLKDDLGLVKLLEAEFREETEQGKDADLIYVDVTDYPGAYSLSGLYIKEGDNIKITIKLFENGEHLKDLEIPPTDDPKRLVKLIVREVKRALD